MSTHMLEADTQAILLLCASFGQNRQTEPQPLTLSEYNELAKWLREKDLRPGDLITPNVQNQLQNIAVAKLKPDRLIALLDRGVMLSLALERWTSKGIWVLGRSDTQYPQRLKKQLGHLAPAILYGVGNIELLAIGGLAIVGSRDVDEEAISYTQRVVQKCAEQEIQVVSGGARGVDRAAMLKAIEVGGTVVGVLSDGLAKASVSGDYRSAIREGKLTLVSPYDPDAGFNVGNAMGRNKCIYGSADYALVVSTSLEKGGTWAGAVEALKQLKHIPVFVRMQLNVPEGNHHLLKKGAKPFPEEPWNESLRQLLVADPLPHTNPTLLQACTPNPLAPMPLELPAPLPPSCQTRPKDIYEAVIPFIVQELEQPKDAKSLAEALGVRLGQLQDWLQRAIAEDRVRKTKKGYLVNHEPSLLSLLPQTTSYLAEEYPVG